MKLLFTEGIGASQTTTNAQDEKIPVYETKTAAENDLANLEIGQIVATKDEGNELSNPVDVVQDGNMHAVTSNAVADAISNIHPTIDISNVFSNRNINITALSNTYGNGRYAFIGQGQSGSLTSTIDIYNISTPTGDVKFYMVHCNYSNGTSTLYSNDINSNPTFSFSTDYGYYCINLVKMCSFV